MTMKNNYQKEVLIQQIQTSYYEELKSITMISQELKISRETVRKIIHDQLQGARNQKEAGEIRGNFKRGYPDIEEKTKRMRKGFIKQLKEGELSQKLSIEKQGEKNNQAKLTEEKVMEIRKRYEEEQIKYGLKKREAQIKLGHEYGVSRQTISSVVNKRTWKHI